MGKIYFQTCAYNSESTISRCIESILNQTRYGDNIVYYICDNGSTDNTFNIIESYARKDERIRLCSNKVNHIWDESSREFLEFRATLDDNDYYCTLDADDAYELNYLENMIPFMKINNLDIAACGSYFLNKNTDDVMGVRMIEDVLLVKEKHEFSKYFMYYHQFMRTVWGKVFSGKVARYMPTYSMQSDEIKGLCYGLDTFLTFSALRKADKIGVIPKILHKYYVSNHSVSYKYDSRRIKSDVILYEDAIDFLLNYGEISIENNIFIHKVYFNAILDTANCIHNSQLTQKEKIAEYIKIVMNPVTQSLFKNSQNEIFGVQYSSFLNIILTEKDNIDRESELDYVNLLRNILNCR